MAGRGVYFALTPDQERRLLAVTGDDDAVRDIVYEEIEEAWDEEWLCETDKAWDAIHRCLTDGRLKTKPNSPRHMCVLGGRQLHRGNDLIVSFLSADDVKTVWISIRDVDEAFMRERYFSIKQRHYDHPLCEEDFGVTAEYFESVQQFFAGAAAANRSVIFTVDQ